MTDAKVFQVDTTAAGIFAQVWSGKAQMLFKRIGNKIAKAVLEEWITRQGLPGLGGHFEERYANDLGYSERGKKYDRRKQRRFGAVDPFVSPKHKLAKGGHVRDLIRQPGTGYRLSATRGEGIAVAMRFPGARKLNMIRNPYGARYRSEFLRLSHPVYGKADREWILGEFRDRFWPAFNEASQNVERATLSTRSRLNARLAKIAA